MTEFRNLQAVTELIALDNGGINRNRSQESRNEEFRAWLAEIIAAPGRREAVDAIEAWLGTLTPEQMLAVAQGEDCGSGYRLNRSRPAGLDDLLNDYFENVC